ncbi:porin [Derxia gummosa]|uniref:Porin n=1 Tax=Derxia gummosa DSM 723 TaxID=1121388 RepID=A0A8B6XB86_9BURK|nr:porin [Derxia gummosa]
MPHAPRAAWRAALRPARLQALATALAAAFAGAAAQAQTAANVTLYGLIDSGVEGVTHASGDRTLWRVPTITGQLPSRLGVRGSEDLGDGLKAVFTIEGGFAPDQGTAAQGGRLWGRQAFVGLQGDWGTLSLGRQYTMLYWGLLDADILGPSIHAMGSLDAGVPNARADNAIAWRGGFGGLQLGATWSTGRDSVGSTPASGSCAGESASAAVACREWSALAGWKTADWGIAAAIDELRGGSGATASFFNGAAPIGLGNAGDKDRRVSVSAWAKLGAVKVGGGWLGRHVDAVAGDVRSNLWHLGAALPVAPSLVIDGALYRIGNTAQNRDATLLALRATHAFSKRTAGYAQAGFLDNSARAQYSVSGGGPGTTPLAGQNQLGTMIGLRHAF